MLTAISACEAFVTRAAGFLGRRGQQIFPGFWQTHLTQIGLTPPLPHGRIGLGNAAARKRKKGLVERGWDVWERWEE